MDSRLENASSEVIEELLLTIRQAKEFTLSQAPDMAKEIVLWGRVTNTASMILALLLFAGALKLIKDIRKGDIDGEWALFAGFLLGIGLVMTGCGFGAFVGAWFTPKIYILDYLTNMAK